MTEADHAETYEQQAQAIQDANPPILDGFEHWLKQAGLSEQTIKAHVDNIRFFGRYLLWSGSGLALACADSMRPARGMSMTF